MPTLIRIQAVLERIVSVSGRLGCWLAWPMMVVILFDVVTRRFLVLGSTASQELEWHIHTVLFLLCLGYAYVVDIHVRIDIFQSRMTPRAKAWLEVVGIICLLTPFIFVLLYHSIDFVIAAYRIREGSATGGGLPYRWIIKAVVPVGLVLVLCSGIARLIREIAVLTSGDVPLNPRRLVPADERSGGEVNR